MKTQAEEQNTNKPDRSIVIDFNQNQPTSGNPFDAVVVNQQPVQEEIVENNEPVENEDVQDIQESDSVQSDEDSQIENNDVSSGQESETDDDSPVDGTETDDSEKEEESDVNPYFYLQGQLKQEGFINDELEFDENVDGMTIYNAYKDKLRSDLEPAVRQEVYTQLANEGFNEHDLLMAKAIRQGIDPRLLSQASAFETYASTADDVDSDQKVNIIKSMYTSRGLEEVEINDIVEAAQNKEEVDKLFGKAKEYFSSKYNEFVQEQNQLAETQREAAEQELKKAQDLISRVVKDQEVLGDRMTKSQTKEFEDAIYKDSEIVEVQGNKYRATEMQKFLLEFQTNPEMKLYMFKKWKFRDQEKDQITKEVQKKVETEFLSEYEKNVIKSKKASKNKKVKQKLEEAKDASNTYFLDFSQKQ